MAQQGMRNFEKRSQIVTDFYIQWKRKWLKNHPGQKEPRVWNYSLRDYIYVQKISRRETAFHAAADLLAVNLIKTDFDSILKYAIKKSEVPTKQGNKRQEQFYKLIILEKELDKATVKLTVGVNKNGGKKVQYCITRIDLGRPKQKRKGTPRPSLRRGNNGVVGI